MIPVEHEEQHEHAVRRADTDPECKEVTPRGNQPVVQLAQLGHRTKRSEVLHQVDEDRTHVLGLDEDQPGVHTAMTLEDLRALHLAKE